MDDWLSSFLAKMRVDEAVPMKASSSGETSSLSSSSSPRTSALDVSVHKRLQTERETRDKLQLSRMQKRAEEERNKERAELIKGKKKAIRGMDKKSDPGNGKKTSFELGSA